MKSLQLTQVIEGLFPMLERLAGRKTELLWKSPEELPLVQADENSLGQVLMNLVINARDSMPDGGQIKIAVESVALNVESSQDNSEARPGEFVCLSVTDSGCGMDSASVQRVFEPFFTTKGTGKGTGLGLSTVYGIVKQHRGWVEVRSQLGRGSEFKVFLPCGENSNLEVGHTTRLARRPAELRGKEVILLIEEDAAVADLAATTLREHGYTVLEAREVREAYQVIQRQQGKIDVLMLEWTVVEMRGGGPLIAELRLENADLKVIYTTGGSLDARAQDGPLLKGISLLRKPYGVGELLVTVRKSLDTPLHENGPRDLLERIALST